MRRRGAGMVLTVVTAGLGAATAVASDLLAPERLERVNVSAVALWIGPGTEAHFADLRLEPR